MNNFQDISTDQLARMTNYPHPTLLFDQAYERRRLYGKNIQIPSTAVKSIRLIPETTTFTFPFSNFNDLMDGLYVSAMQPMNLDPT